MAAMEWAGVSETEYLDIPIQLEATGFIASGMQLAVREYASEVVFTGKKLIIRAFDLEGWSTPPWSDR